jgi:DNA helicase-2/ATP-dependent DNA helicase PcrA
MQWSTEQDAIFDWFQNGTGNLVVRARAGTGKTTTIKRGVSLAPEAKILMAAFNQRIAKELKAAVEGLGRSGVEAKTLHGLGYAYVRYRWKGVKVDNGRDEDIAAEVCGREVPDEAVKLVQELASKAKAVEPMTRSAAVLERVARGFRIEADEEMARRGYGDKWIAARALDAMKRACEEDGSLSFDDMLYVPVRMKWVRPWFDMVVIDEAQDMSHVQLLLAQQACKRTGRIVVVGDDRQAIYSWRGADSDSLDRLKEELEATELGLTTTYRCGRLIVERAQKLVPDYNAAPQAHDGEIQGMDVAGMLAAVKPGDYVLSRKNAPLVTVCMALLRAGVPARVAGRELGKQIMRLIRKIVKREGSTTAELLKRLGEWEETQMAKAKTCKRKVEREEREREVEDNAEVIRALAAGTTLVDEIDDKLDALCAEDPSGVVVCSSVHKAKGLESDRVFVLSATLRRGQREEENIEYVAVTRARHTLVEVTGEI